MEALKVFERQLGCREGAKRYDAIEDIRHAWLFHPRTGWRMATIPVKPLFRIRR
jgi:hypothetical protein